MESNRWEAAGDGHAQEIGLTGLTGLNSLNSPTDPNVADAPNGIGRASRSAPGPTTIDGYRVCGVLGRGAASIVYRAVQKRPHRDVAIKVLRAGFAGGELDRRLDHEAHALARLQHVNIARIFGVGVLHDGVEQRPYIAMELVEGRSLTEHVRRRSLGCADRLALLATVCRAVHHAHQKGVIHRDLKPGNILVDDAGGVGEPKILDFGISRVLRIDGGPATFHTGAGEVLGTLPYMSPEQLAGGSADVDIRADIYALGVIGYEMLADRLPHAVEGRGIAEFARAIETPPQALGAFDRALRGDVETIVAKAMSIAPERRYESAAAMADDIERHLRGDPIAARPAPVTHRVARMVRRHRGVAAFAAGVLSVAMAGLVVGLQSAWREADERAMEARVKAAAADILERLVVTFISRADPADSEAALRKALGDIDALPGDNVRIGLSIRRMLAGVLWLQRRFAESAAMFGECSASCEARFPPDDALRLDARNSLAVALRDNGELVDAEAIFQDLLAFVSARLPGGRERRAKLLSNYAILLVRGNRSNEAIPLLEEALGTWSADNPEHDESRMVVLSWLARAKARTGDTVEALDLSSRAMDLHTSSGAIGRWRAGAAVAARADVLARAGRRDAALALLADDLADARWRHGHESGAAIWAQHRIDEWHEEHDGAGPTADETPREDPTR